MKPVSPELIEITRKNSEKIYSQFLRRLAAVTQERAAACMNVSPSTISRSKEDMERACHLLAALGFQLAPAGSVVTTRDDIQALKRMAYKYLQSEIDVEIGGTDE